MWEGLWNNTTSVAVKMQKIGTMSASDFLLEAAMLTRLHHSNVIQLHAVCTKEEPIYIMTELMKHGSLMNYLRGEGRSLKLPQLINMSAQVASGMAYLEEQNVVHLDLTSKTILVGDHMICKVSDFQQAKILEDYIFKPPKEFTFPIMWTAPEGALYCQYTIKSDVWSFGIVLWEIINYGRFPYPGMSNEQVLDALQKGYRMSRPFGCPDKLHNIMLDCWKEDSDSRPTFKSLLVQLEDFSTDDTGYLKVDDA